MQTILGAGGVIGIELAKALKDYTDAIRLVSRNPKKVNDTDILFPADLSNNAQVDKAIEGSDVVYVTIGFDYNIKVWREKWPTLIKAVIESCEKHQAKLVFFDNVYMYDPNEIPNMTEASRINPSSKKGKVRAEVAQMILDAVQSKKITALIARSADFYGPHNDKSVLVETVIKNLKKGKTAQWFADATQKHSFTYTTDAAKATALLGNTPDAYNQVWHLPTDKNTLNGKEWTTLFASELGKKPKVSALPKFMLQILGWFIPIMSELHEMVYQYDRPYFFDSSKFEKRFPKFSITSYREGAKATINHI